MKDILQIDGKEMHSIKNAASVFSYSRDYITRLARDQKIKASQIGRQWYVDLSSLESYVADVAAEQAVRKKQLSEKRKAERNLLELATNSKNILATKANRSHLRACTAMMVIMSMGVFSGMAFLHVQEKKISPSLVARLFVPEKSTTLTAALGSTARPVTNTKSAVGNKQTAALAAPATFARQEISSTTQGILLLPNNSLDAGTSTAAAMFSDVVVIKDLPNGLQEVVRVDAQGEVMGEAIPFVSVPVQAASDEIDNSS